MIATETPILLAKVTEAFIADLTVRAFATELENGMRRTLQVCAQVSSNMCLLSIEKKLVPTILR